MSEIQDKYSELYRRSSITCKARYHAASRMASHAWFSQWTLALLAVGQILIALINSLGFEVELSSFYINFMSIFFGVLVLTYSLLLGMSNFSARAVEFHRNGLELGRVTRKLYALQCGHEEFNDTSYNRISKHYYNILDKYENHKHVDYLSARYEYYTAEEDKKNNDFWSGAKLRAKNYLYGVKLEFYLLNVIQYSHYIASIILMYAWIYFLILRISS